MFNSLGAAALFLLDVASAATLFASHYSGTINVLTLTGSETSYSLTQSSSLKIQGQPSWLTFDSSSRTLYAADETTFGSGSVTSISASTSGVLAQTGRVTAVGGGVANVVYGTGLTKFIATAHYQTSTVSTFKLPLSSSSSALQTLKYTLTGPGTNPSRQDAAHPHEVLTDPTGAFLLAPDLGADLIRIYSINQASGELTSCPDLKVKGGTGPRHAAFWVPSSGATMMYAANELANTVSTFSVTYPTAGCLSFALEQSLTGHAGNRSAVAGTKLGEIHVKDNFVYATNRNDKSFSQNDSISSFEIGSNGLLTYLASTSTGGTYARTFAINTAGDLVAIGDQTTSNVVIVTRDTKTGLLGQQVATLRIGNAGTPENEDGLSSVVWDQ